MFNGNVAQFTAGTLTGLFAGEPLLVMLAFNSGNTHLIAAHPGRAPVVITQNVGTGYTTNMTTNAMVSAFGGGLTATSANAYYGPMEEAFMLTRAGADLFTESGGVPDDALIRAIANGTQSIDGLDTLLTGTRSFRYRMLHNADLVDAWGVAAALTKVNEDLPSGKQFYNYHPLRPGQIIPKRSRGSVSQCTFGTPGVQASASCTIKTPGGTYSGLTPAAVQHRLRKEDGTALIDWVTTDPAPAGGVYVEGQIDNVPMTAGFLAMDTRFIDGGGTQIGPIVAAMTTGAGFHMLWGPGQSQFEITHDSGNLAIPSGSRFFSLKQSDPSPTNNQAVFLLGSADETGTTTNTGGMGQGARSACVEINARFPGVPIQISIISQAGDGIEQFAPGGANAGRWAEIALSMGVVQPFIWMALGHSAGADATYEAKFTSAIELGRASLGEPLIFCHMPVSRYSLAGTNIATGTALQVDQSRRGMREWHKKNPTISYWGGSLAPVRTDEGVNADPHPVVNTFGVGRIGAIMGQRAMEASRAVTDETVGIVSGVWSGNSVVLTLGRVSDYPDP